MANAYIPFTQLGFVMDIPAQTGDEMPDGLAKLDDALQIESVDDPAKIADRVNDYRQSNELLTRLAGTQDAYIESEHTTGATQPSQTVRNLVQAHNRGHRCLFFARESVAEQVYDTVGHEPMCCRSNHPKDDEERFYTGTTTLRIDGEEMTRPGGSENVWVHDTETGQYILRDRAGTVHVRFDTPADIFTDASAYPDSGDRNIKPPVIPQYEIGGEDVEEIEWDIIVVPEPERDEEGNESTLTPADLELYREGAKNVPLIDLTEDATEDEKSEPRGDEQGPSVNSETDETPGQDRADAVADSSSDEHEDEEDYLEDALSGVFN